MMLVSPTVTSLLFETLPRHFRQKSVDAVMPRAAYRPDFQVGRDRLHQDLPWWATYRQLNIDQMWDHVWRLTGSAKPWSQTLHHHRESTFVVKEELCGSLWCKLRQQKSSQISAAMQVSRVAKATSQMLALKPPPMTQGGPTAGSH